MTPLQQLADHEYNVVAIQEGWDRPSLTNLHTASLMQEAVDDYVMVSLADVRDLMAEALSTIESLADQQAMADDWWAGTAARLADMLDDGPGAEFIAAVDP